MECFRMPEFQRFRAEELEQFSLHWSENASYRKELQTEIRMKIQQNWDHVAKPLNGMGRFEDMIGRIGAIQGTTHPNISRKGVLIFCADNGVVEEGVSQSGKEVTAAVAASMGKQRSSVGKMAVFAGAVTIPVDVGICDVQEIPGVLNRKIRAGTRNFCIEPAMTEEETMRALATGMELVFQCKKEGYGLLAMGEMGIGNTTTSSAVAASLLHCSVEEVTGRGAGLSDAGLLRKKQVIQSAIDKYQLYDRDVFSVLRTVGGLDIAALAGMCIGGALFQIPIVLDGVISMVAALCAERLMPGTKDCLIASHSGKEPAVKRLEQALEVEPVLDAGLALGEGTGAVLLFPLLDMAMCVYERPTEFSDIQVEQYKRFEQ